jgi:hypothetical protein
MAERSPVYLGGAFFVHAAVQQSGWLMNNLRNFLSLRPVITRRVLALVWLLYLVNWLLEVVGLIMGTRAGGVSWPDMVWMLPAFVPQILRLLLVRILLETAAAVLLGPPLHSRDTASVPDSVPPVR